MSYAENVTNSEHDPDWHNVRSKIITASHLSQNENLLDEFVW